MIEKHSDNVGQIEPPTPTAFRPLYNKTVVDRIICRLLTAVMNKDLLPGQKIPSEMDLCESMQVGRNSVREAIKVLVAMGMLNIRRSEGTFVSKGFSEKMLNPMVYGLLLEDSDSNSVIELYRVFEAGILQVVAEKRTDEDIENLRGAIERLKQAVQANPDEASVLEVVNDFQKTLSRVIKNPLVNKINIMISGRMTLPIRSAAVRRLIETNALDDLVVRYEELLRIVVDRDFCNAPQAIENLFSMYGDA